MNNLQYNSDVGPRRNLIPNAILYEFWCSKRYHYFSEFLLQRKFLSTMNGENLFGEWEHVVPHSMLLFYIVYVCETGE